MYVGIRVQLGVLPYRILCEQYYAIKPLTQDMHTVTLLALEVVNKNYFTANVSTQKKSTKASVCRLTC